MSLKLIAIRPLIGISSKYLKNLTAGEVYNLCNDYVLLNRNTKPITQNDEVYSIEYKRTVPNNLYSITKINGDVINVNVSAVVGKNGAGKSSLMDLLLHSIFVVSNNLGFVNSENFIESSSDSLERHELDVLNKELKEIKKGLLVEIYYLLNDNYYRLRIENGEFNLESCSCEDKRARFGQDDISIKRFNEINNFFYTILVNYSLYSYNSNYNGIWIKSFFHKNDGYQMPVVINPFRNKGNIDINSETLLTRSRLLSNILSISSYKKINYKSSIEKIELFFDKSKDYKFLSNGESRFSTEFIEKFRTMILSPLFAKMFESIPYPTIDTPIKEYAEIYLINKLITIPTKYESFKEFDKRFARVKERSDNYDLTQNAARAYVNDLYEDRSHVTLKVRQTLNFLREDIYNLPSSLDFKTKFDIGSVVRKMTSLKRKDWFTELVDYLPPPFLFSRIRFTDGSYFEDLSSGEKQKIYSLNSVIYHLRNLESINNNKNRNADKKISSYQAVNLMFDEVELYYHPQYQKETISSLLYLIRISNFRFIKNINIIFLTHSPFILSDIPIQNTALLTIDKKTGKSKLITNKKKQSFGANIHDLLADNFFLTGSLIGDLADKRIMKLIERTKKSELTKDDKLLLKLIGDTFLKSSIEQYRQRNDQDRNT